MRLVGTGTAPEGQYPEDVVFDVPDAQDGQATDLLDKGWARKIDPATDPGRTPLQIANSAVRGDTLTHPEDIAVAYREGYLDENGQATEKARAVVHEQDTAADPADFGEGLKPISRAAEEARSFGRAGVGVIRQPAEGASPQEFRENAAAAGGGPAGAQAGVDAGKRGTREPVADEPPPDEDLSSLTIAELEEQVGDASDEQLNALAGDERVGVQELVERERRRREEEGGQ